MFPRPGQPPLVQAERAVQGLARMLTERGQTLAAAESCTGGWIAKLLTDLPGSSAWFGYGVVSYANAAKMQLLGVSEASLRTHGAVSEAVVKQMAEGVRLLASADYARRNGVVGAGGGTPDKPVGTVWAAWSSAEGTTAHMERFCGDRDEVRAKTVAWVLCELDQQLAQIS
ncbi:MAG: nicotinamide-nucleotide amidohydrolase family protein [Pseudomonadota bacterium]